MFLTTLFSGAELLVLGRVIESDLEVVCLVFFFGYFQMVNWWVKLANLRQCLSEEKVFSSGYPKIDNQNLSTNQPAIDWLVLPWVSTTLNFHSASGAMYHPMRGFKAFSGLKSHPTNAEVEEMCGIFVVGQRNNTVMSMFLNWNVYHTSLELGLV